MLNYGYGNSLMRGTVKCGKPFLASFDAQTGDREKMFPLYDKKHVMNDGMLTESGVFLAGSDKAVYLSFADSAVISKDWDRRANGALTMVLRKPFYAFHGLAPKLTLVEAFDKVCPMQTSTNKLLSSMTSWTFLNLMISTRLSPFVSVWMMCFAYKTGMTNPTLG